jgi:hypothetical protein
MIVKKTCMNKLTAFTITLSRYNHASPGISLEHGSQEPVIVRMGGIELVFERGRKLAMMTEPKKQG